MPEFKDPRADFYAYIRRAEKETNLDKFLEKERARNPDESPRGWNTKAPPNFRDLVANPDAQTLIETGDPRLVEEGRDMLVGVTSAAYVKAAGDSYYPTDANLDRLVRTLCETHKVQFRSLRQATAELQGLGVWTVKNLEAVVAKLTRAGALEVPAGAVRVLTPEQLRDIAAAVLTDGADTAVEDYISYSFGGNPPYVNNHREIFAKFPDVITRACTFVFKQTQFDFVDSAEWREFISSRPGGKYSLLTVPALQALWNAFKARGGGGSGTPPTAPLSPPSSPPSSGAPTKEQLEDMPLEELEPLWKASLRERARQKEAGRHRSLLGTPRS